MNEFLDLPVYEGPVITPTRQIQPHVRAEDVSRVYMQGGMEVTALAHVSCRILPDDRIAITGRSGSGKSTLIHILGGLDQPSSGRISWPGLGLLDDLRPSKIGIALQVHGLLPALTVAENVALPLLLCQTAPEDAQAAAIQTLEELELADLAAKLPEELSGGQAQRVSLARALATRPPLVMADEPTGQLDHPTANRMLDQLFQALESRQSALVIATHDLAIASRMNQIWNLHQGRLVNKDNP